MNPDSSDYIEDSTVESPKKIHQSITELARQLDVSSSRCTKVEELFSSEILTKRLRIRDLCEKLITQHSSKSYGSLARERLWRFVFYDAVVRARKLQRDKQWTPLQLAYLKNHMLNGIGQLHLFCIQIHESEDSEGISLLARPNSIDGILNEDMILVHKSRDQAESALVSHKWLVELIHMCLINIGDLYRYLTDIYSKIPDICMESHEFFDRALEYYTQAFLVNPSSGLSHNQLGNLYSEHNWGIDSIYYLLYSMLCENAYDGAYPNMRQLIDRKTVQYARLPASKEQKPMDVMCHGFLSMVNHLLSEESRNLPSCEKICQETLANFHERLVSYDPDLDEKLLFKICCISIMTVWQLQMRNSANTPPAVAFAMSIFFQLVNQLSVVLEEHSHVEKTYCTLPTTEYVKDLDQVSVESIEEAQENADIHSEVLKKPEKKKQRKKVGVPRGRYRRSRGSIPSLHSENSDEEFDGSEEEEDSEEDYWSGLTSDSEDSNSSSDEEDAESDVKQTLANSERSGRNEKAFETASSNGQSDESATSSQKSGEGLRQSFVNGSDIQDRGETTPSRFLNLDADVDGVDRLMISAENLTKCQGQIKPLLAALTPFTRWLQTCPAVKDAFAANAEKVFLEKLCRILSILVSADWMEVLEEVSIPKELSVDWSAALSEVENNNKNIFCWELQEDRSMLGLSAIKEFLQALEIKDDLSWSDTYIIRIGRLVSFGRWMSNCGSFSMLYTEETRKFVVPTAQVMKDHIRMTRMRKLLAGKDESEGVMRLTKAYKELGFSSSRRGRRNRGRRFDSESGNFGEPRDRRRQGGGLGGGSRSAVEEVFAVIDLSAALNHFKNVKDVACFRGFVVYIPNSVWKTLDMLKDTEEEGSKEARVAFRWIERAFQRNHPGVRLLKEDQKEAFEADYPVDPTDVDAWEYFDMLEHCRYLMRTKLSGTARSSTKLFGDLRDKYRMFYLSGIDRLLDTSAKRSFDPIRAARAAGVFVDYVNLYPPYAVKKARKWKTSGKCKG